MEKFYRLTTEKIGEIAELNLTSKEQLLLLYLITLDPFGDKEVRIPPFEIIERTLHISKASYYRAKAKLQKLNLFNFTDKYCTFQNLRPAVPSYQSKLNVCLSAETRVSEMRKDSQGREKILTDEKEFSQMRKSEAETQSGKESQLSKTIKTIKTSSDSGVEEEDEGSIATREIYEALEDKDYVAFLYGQNPSIRNPIAYLQFTPEGSNKNNFRLSHDLYLSQKQASPENLEKWSKIKLNDPEWLNFPYKTRWLDLANQQSDPCDFIELFEKQFPRNLKIRFLKAMQAQKIYKTKKPF